MSDPAATIRAAGRDDPYDAALQFVLALGQKFVSLLGQSSVLAFAGVTAILALAEKFQAGWLGPSLIAVAPLLGILFYWRIAVTYFRQIHALGLLMRDLEYRGGAGPPGIMAVLKEPRLAFYGRRRNYWLANLYYLALCGLLAGAVVAVVFFPVRPRP